MFAFRFTVLRVRSDQFDLRAYQLYIHPTECIECGACEPECPVEAISYTDTGDDLERSRRLFFEVLLGRELPLGSPGGAADLGLIDASP